MFSYDALFKLPTDVYQVKVCARFISVTITKWSVLNAKIWQHLKWFYDDSTDANTNLYKNNQKCPVFTDTGFWLQTQQ